MAEPAEPLTRVMVIAAHPDDPEFGCAGTVVKWAQAGKQVTYVLLTSGDKGSHDPDLRPGRLAARRESEQRAAAAELGVSQVIFLRHPDGILENTLELRRELADDHPRSTGPHIVAHHRSVAPLPAPSRPSRRGTGRAGCGLRGARSGTSSRSSWSRTSSRGGSARSICSGRTSRTTGRTSPAAWKPPCRV